MRRIGLLFKLLEHGGADVRLRIGEQLHQRRRRLLAADVLEPPQAELADQRIVVAEQLDQQRLIGGRGQPGQFVGGLLAMAGIGVGQPLQPARPAESQRIGGDQAIAEGPKPLALAIVGRVSFSRAVTSGSSAAPQAASRLRIASASLSLALSMRSMSRRASTSACSVSFLAVFSWLAGDAGLELLGPEIQGRNPLLGEALRLPGIEIGERGPPLPQEFQGGQPPRQAAFREGADDFRAGLLRIGRQPPDRRLADSRVPLLELPKSTAPRRGVGLAVGQQHLVGLSRSGLVLLLEPTHQVFGRNETVLLGHRLAQHRADPQGRNAVTFNSPASSSALSASR